MVIKGLSNQEVAGLLGFSNPSVVSMIKSGRMQLPEDKLAATVRHLDIDAATLLKAWSRSRNKSDVHALLEMCLSTEEPSLVEARLMSAYRDAFQDVDVGITPEDCSATPELAGAVLLLLKAIRKERSSHLHVNRSKS